MYALSCIRSHRQRIRAFSHPRALGLCHLPTYNSNSNVAKNAQNESIARPTFERIHTHTSIQHSTHTSTCSIYLFLLASIACSTGSEFLGFHPR